MEPIELIVNEMNTGKCFNFVNLLTDQVILWNTKDKNKEFLQKLILTFQFFLSKSEREDMEVLFVTSIYKGDLLNLSPTNIWRYVSKANLFIKIIILHSHNMKDLD